MVQDRRIYGEVDSKTDLREVSAAIRRDVEQAKTREELTELYRRSGYLITLTHSPAWKEKFGDKAVTLRHEAEKGFTTTARAINKRARAINTEADYDETWGDGR